MRSFVAILWLLPAVGQDEPARLVEKLRSERIEEREEAERKLRALGPGAVSELEKAGRGADPEVAGRARRLLGVIEISGKLTPRFRRMNPGIEEKLALGEDHEWTDIFIRQVDNVPYPFRADIEPLAGRALRGARSFEEKVRMCTSLVHYRIRSAASGIRGLLRDGDWQVRTLAALSLADLEDRDAVPDLLRSIERQVEDAGPIFMLDENFFEALNRLEAKGALVRLLKHFHPSVRGEAAIYLREEGWADTVGEIEPLLKDPDSGVRSGACLALAFFRARSAIPCALELLQDEGFENRFRALEALASLDAREAAPRIAKLLEDPGKIRGFAATSLARLGDRKSVPKIIALLDDDESVVRANAAGALSMLSAREAIPALVAMTRHGDLERRKLAAETLAELGGGESIQALRPLLKDNMENVVAASLEGLSRHQATEAVPDILEIIRDKTRLARRTAVSSIVKFGGRDRLPLLLECLDDTDFNVRVAALEAIAQLAGREHLPAIARRLKDPHPSVCRITAWLLGPLGATAYVSDLEAMVSGPDEEMRIPAAASLCLLGSRKGVQLLLDHHYLCFHFNALLRPDEWGRLQAPVREMRPVGRAGDLLDQAARQAKLTVEYSGDLPRAAVREFVRPPDAREWRLRNLRTILDVVEHLIPGDCDMILGPDRLRIVPRDEALSFWLNWHEAGQGGTR